MFSQKMKLFYIVCYFLLHLKWHLSEMWISWHLASLSQNTTVLHTVVCLCVSMDVHKHKCLDVFLFVKHLHVLLFSLLLMIFKTFIWLK